MSAEDAPGTHVARALAALAVGDAPAEAMQLCLCSRLTGIPKKGGLATRILACGGVARRLVARTLCHLYRDQIGTAAGPQQFGVGVKAGTEQLHKVLSAHAVRHSDHCFVSLDVSNAFPRLVREEAARRIVAQEAQSPIRRGKEADHPQAWPQVHEHYDCTVVAST